MKTNLKSAWVANLRSGKFDQTQEALHDNMGYCCLGVLLETAIDAGLPVVKNEPREDEENIRYGVENDSWGPTNDAELDDPLRELLGLDSQIQKNLIRMNDDEHKDFITIADYIEEKVNED